MKRLWVILAAIVACGLSLEALNANAQRAQVPDEFKRMAEIATTDHGRVYRDFAPTKPATPTLYSDATPMLSVRFDGAKSSIGVQVAAFLRRQIEVTLTLWPDNVGESGYLSWDEIRELQDLATSFNTTLHIAQGGASAFTDVATMHHGEFVDELAVDAIVRETGYRPRVLVVPHTDAAGAWFRSNINYVQSVADSLGLWYIDSEVPSSVDNTEWLNIFPRLATIDIWDVFESGMHAPYWWLKPGLDIDRSSIYSQQLDGGNYVVERAAGSGYPELVETGIRPPAADEWTLAGQGADAAATGNYDQTFAYVYSNALATGHGFQIVVDDSTDTDVISPVITGIDIGERQGQFSPDHVAWVVAMLRAEGFVQTGGIEAYCEWVTGDWAVNTDLIDNQRMRIPQIAVGDTVGTVAEHAAIAGLGAHNLRRGSQSSTAGGQVGNLDAQQAGNLATYVRRESSATADNPYYAIGDSVQGTRGRPGGVSFNVDSAGFAPYRVAFVMGGLKPGADYLFSVDVFVPDGVNPGAEEFHLATWLRAYQLHTSFEAEFTTTNRDTMVAWNWRDNTVTLNLDNDEDNRWGTYRIPLTMPDWPLGDVLVGSDYGSDDESTGLFSPLSTGANQGYITDNQWVWSFQMVANGAMRMSNPRFIYLGD